MNYIVLNGKRSTLIKGLLIQSLPPVSKPLMRSSIEQIDGRDGDIVTKLGYSAYDKQVSVGLHGNFDVDEVIQFFDTEGIVIFSNEPDKFYKFTVLEQIDFERLIRFRTAIITFHVQPFKYSAVDDLFTFNKDELGFRTYTETKTGITVQSANGVVSVTGTASDNTEIYVPINPMTLGAGDYTLKAVTDGTGESGCQIRVCGTVATDADSFNGASLNLADAGTAEMSGTLSAQKTFGYVWIYVPSGTVADFTLDVQMLNGLDQFNIVNRGNVESRPVMTIHGTGTVKLSINDVELFTLTMGTAGYITIDSEQMEAYKGDTLMNRSVSGDYDKLVLRQGTNKVSWTGNVSKVVIQKYGRWI